jgi:hypothetical protein
LHARVKLPVQKLSITLYNNMTLNRLVLNVARPKLFYDWLKAHDKLGGQHKIPRLSNDRDYLEQLKAMHTESYA